MKTAFVFAISMAAAAGVAPRALAAQAGDKIYFEFQVSKPVASLPGSKAPRYPVELKSNGVEGEVLAQFVVDTFGVAELTSFRLLKSSHKLFADAVLAALPDMRFTSAEVNGRKVKQLVQQPFVFNIQRIGGPGTTTPTPPTPAMPARPESPISMFQPATIAPAPPAGTVDGWIVEHRTSVDSGTGTPATMTVRVVFAQSRARIEIADTRRPDIVVMVADTIADRMTLMMDRTKSAILMKRPERSTMPLEVKLVSRSVKTEALGSSEPLLGVPTKHLRLQGRVVTRVSLGSRSCVLDTPVNTDTWRTTAPEFVTGLRLSRHMFQAYARTLVDFGEDRGAPDDSLAGVALRTVTTQTGRKPDGTTLTVRATTEVTRFSHEAVPLASFEPPEGYRVRDMTRMVSPPRSDSLTNSVWERAFTRMVDSTAMGPGATRQCTEGRAPSEKTVLQASEQPTLDAPRQAIREMQDALRQLVWGEEAYWAKHESYTTDLVAVRAGMQKQPAQGVMLSIHFAGGRAWTASAEHRDLPRRSCVIFVGSIGDFPAPATLNDGLRPQANEPGTPVCDRL